MTYPYVNGTLIAAFLGILLMQYRYKQNMPLCKNMECIFLEDMDACMLYIVQESNEKLSRARKHLVDITGMESITNDQLLSIASKAEPVQEELHIIAATMAFFKV